MKSNKVIRIAILPLVLVAVLAFTNMPNQKNEKSQGQGNEKEKGKQDKGNFNKDQNNKGQGNEQNSSGKSSDRVKGNNDKHGSNSDRGNNWKGKEKSDKFRSGENIGDAKIDRGNGNSKMKNGKRDENIDWNLNDFSNRKHPKDRKKVTICHKPSAGDSNNGVTINVSENALQAHMNHGDLMGNCNIDYSDRWSSDYIRSRENVYSVYEQTWETMSYSEALLKLAIEKLLGVRTNLDQNRSGYTQQELQRRQALIYELQNNVNSLESQLGVTRQRLDSDVNIIIQL